MEPAPPCQDEAARLEALQRMNLLDTPPRAALDRLTKHAAALLAVPVVLISLVDSKRQWFLSRVGLQAQETPREVAFCAHAVAADAPLVVPDAARDPRFADNPLVTGEPYVRAYLGIPIHAPGGMPIGTLCAIDHEARDFSPQDLEVLRRLAQMVERLTARGEPEVR